MKWFIYFSSKRKHCKVEVLLILFMYFLIFRPGENSEGEVAVPDKPVSNTTHPHTPTKGIGPAMLN